MLSLHSSIKRMQRKMIWLIILLVSCSEGNNTIKVKGSDTEVNLAVQLSETFHKINPAYFVSISGGGSGLGIASLINGTADVANSSRSINQKEKELFSNRKTAIDSFVFAQDAIGFVVANDLPIDSISADNLGKLLNGTYKNWSSIIQSSLPVNIYGRQSNSGTHDFVKERLNIKFSAAAKEMNGNAQILEGIKNDHSGIGYVGAGYLIHGGAKGLKVLKIAATINEQAYSALDSAIILQGKYIFQRPLFQYFKKADWQKIKQFIEFEKSPQGQKIIRDAGYYPVQ